VSSSKLLQKDNIKPEQL